MNAIFTREGFGRLRASWLLLALSFAMAIGIGPGSQWFLQKEKREGVSAERGLQQARARLEKARRESADLTASQGVFRTLVERGLLQAERRLDMVELVSRLKARHQLLAVDYEIAPQRALALAAGQSLRAVDVLSSRVKLKLRALHEGDVLGFLDELAEATQGAYPMDRCAIRRLEDSGFAGLQARVEADCAFEWITLKEKS